MLRGTITVALSFVLAVLFLVTETKANSRVALVIGNSNYQSVANLPNTVNDANDLSNALERVGFSVTKALDLSSADMRTALRDFGQTANGADMAIVFFAGHGLEISGTNFLIPVDAKLRNDLDVYYEAMPLELVMAAVSGAKGLRMVLLDACRNNPFAATMRSTSTTRSVGRGLSRIEPTRGMLVSYAAKEGTTADDGDGRNSPYTNALLNYLEEPGLDVQFLFRKVRDQVLSDTNGRQEPFTYGSLPGKRIYLVDPVEPTTSAPQKIDDVAIELAYWNAVKDSRSIAIIQTYLDKYPNGQFAALAKVTIQTIQSDDRRRKAKVEAAQRQVAEKARLEELARQEAKAKLLAAEKAEALARERRAQELVDWGKVRTSTDTSVLLAYVQKYPDGTFTDLARARLEEMKRIRTAELTPPTSEVAPSTEDSLPALSRRELVTSIQKELQRLGCSPGRPDGAWGKGSRAALQRFARHSKSRVASLSPSRELLDKLSRQKTRVCPLICGKRQVLKGGRCVAKTCRRGQKLNSSGVCVNERKREEKKARKNPGKPDKKKKATQTKKPSRAARSNSGGAAQCGRCRDFFDNVNRYCGAAYAKKKRAGYCN